MHAHGEGLPDREPPEIPPRHNGKHMLRVGHIGQWAKLAKPVDC